MIEETNRSSAMIVLEAFEQVYPDRVDIYEVAACRIDEIVKQTEPGMLIHALSRQHATTEAITYRWLEVFANSAALSAHLDNPAVLEHTKLMSDGILTGPVRIVIHANWVGEECEYWKERLATANFSLAKSCTAFYRIAQ